MHIPLEKPSIIHLINTDDNPDLISKIYTNENNEACFFTWRKDMTKISIVTGEDSVMF